jgi:hypothetical protein
MATEDPKTKLTNWLTAVPAEDESGTRLMSKEQKDFYVGYKALGRELDIPFFEKIVDLDERLMMAYQGRRSDDVVESLRSVKQEDKINTGVQPVQEELRKRYKSQE